jgi:hypothetical protein
MCTFAFSAEAAVGTAVAAAAADFGTSGSASPADAASLLAIFFAAPPPALSAPAVAVVVGFFSSRTSQFPLLAVAIIMVGTWPDLYSRPFTTWNSRLIVICSTCETH